MRLFITTIICVFVHSFYVSAKDIPSREDLKLADAYRLKLHEDVAFQLSWMKSKASYLEYSLDKKFGPTFFTPAKEKEPLLPKYYVRQVFISLPQRRSTQIHDCAQLSMDSIYNAFTLDQTDKHLAKLIALFSDEKKAIWINSQEETREFQRVLERLKVGEVSQPFTSPRGLHIVQLLDKREQPLHAADVVPLNKPTLINLLGLTINSKGEQELLTHGNTNLPLIKSPHKLYTQKELDEFAQGNLSLGIDGLWHKFQDYVLFDQMIEAVLADDTTVFVLDSIYREKLTDAVYEVRVVNSELKTAEKLVEYYNQHKADYYWEVPRFQGVVVFCKSRKVRKALHDELSNTPWGDWEKVIDRFNVDRPLVYYELGQFERGANGVIDAYVFKKGKKKHFKRRGYTKTRIYGEVLKGPETYEEVKSQVENDYIRVIEQTWVDGLERDYKSGKLKVNLLNSVN